MQPKNKHKVLDINQINNCIINPNKHKQHKYNQKVTITLKPPKQIRKTNQNSNNIKIVKLKPALLTNIKLKQ